MIIAKESYCDVLEIRSFGARKDSQDFGNFGTYCVLFGCSGVWSFFMFL